MAQHHAYPGNPCTNLSQIEMKQMLRSGQRPTIGAGKFNLECSEQQFSIWQFCMFNIRFSTLDLKPTFHDFTYTIGLLVLELWCPGCG